MTELIRSECVKTRKEHQCFGCLRIFPAGTVMDTQVVRHEGEISTVYSCITCGNLMSTFQEHFYEEMDRCYPHGCIHESAERRSGESPEHMLIRLTTERDEKVKTHQS